MPQAYRREQPAETTLLARGPPLAIHLDLTPGVRIASRLLGLGPSYPPSQAVSGVKPIIDVSSTTGQVFLVLDPRRSSPSKRDSPGGGRRDWLIVLEFELGVERCIERGLSR